MDAKAILVENDREHCSWVRDTNLESMVSGVPFLGPPRRISMPQDNPSATGGWTNFPGVFKDRRKPAHRPRAAWTSQRPK